MFRRGPRSMRSWRRLTPSKRHASTRRASYACGVAKPAERRQMNHRSGLVRDAVLVVLADCHTPARVRDIHAAVCDLLGQPVPRSSVKGWLGRQVSARDPLVTRSRPGHYALTAPPRVDTLGRARRRTREG